LLVDDSPSDDSSIVLLNSAQLAALQLSSGDHILLRGKMRKTTVGIVYEDESVSEGRVKMNGVSRSNIR
jgi:transitional endoplasmic reticulum ATPase